MHWHSINAWAFCLLVLSPLSAEGQLLSAQGPIDYLKAKPEDSIARLQKEMDAGTKSLAFDARHGYLPAVLKALGIPESSQTLVFSKTSFQRDLISPWSPRALYFSADAYVGWVRTGPVLEVASVDKNLGTVFYTLDQDETDRPHFRRQTTNCLQCHEGSMTEGIPGLVLRSTFTQASGSPLLDIPNFLPSPASPFKERWGGWYVTGKEGKMQHMGNLVIHAGESPERADLTAGNDITDLSMKFDTERYLSAGSDVVALMVFAHQAQVHNLLTAANYRTRIALAGAGAADPAAEQIEKACEPLIRALLFCDEVPLPNAVTGSSSFTKDFPAGGPRDKKGRSLRDLDLSTRLFKYPCSYLIYTESFGTLPAPARAFIYQRLFNILTSKEGDAGFKQLSVADRQAVVEILRDTVKDLPAYWR